MKINLSNLNFTAKQMSYEEANSIKNHLKNSKNLDIVCHELSDRDSVNSAIVMYDYLQNLGVNSRIILSQDINSLGLRDENKNFIQAKDLGNDEKADTILCSDFSASNRIPKNVLDYVKNANKVLCLDHHYGADLMKLNKEKNINVPFYVDPSAKSTTSVIYRFFEALNENFNDDTAYDLFYGLVDDAVKRGLVECDGKKGIITPKQKLIKNKEAYEIYETLEKRLSEEEIHTIAKNIDIISSLTGKYKDFYDSLYKQIKLSKNGKIAYIEIPPDSKIWKDLGGDTTLTSTILNRFRQNVLKDEKYKDVKSVINFIEADSEYKLSIHSKDKNLHEFYDYAKRKVKEPSFVMGGHSTRGGGKISTTDVQKCKKWVQEVINCDDFYN